MNHPCSALRNGTCVNGFPVAPICRHTEMIDYDGPRRTYSGFPAVPFCLDEIQCGRAFPVTGRPELETLTGEKP